LAGWRVIDVGAGGQDPLERNDFAIAAMPFSSRFGQLLGLTPGNLITHLRKLQDTGYVTNVKSRRGGNGPNVGRHFLRRA
jgi:hypothetical protein